MEHKNNFNAMRLLGALLVVCSHQFALSGRWEPRFVGDHSFGNLGLLCFFSISGFLVTASLESDPHPFRFLARRFLRIVPGLLVALAIANAAVSYLGLQGFPGHPHHELNGSLWTISLEIYCYLLLLLASLIFPNPTVPFSIGIFAAWLISGGQSTTFFLAYFGLFFAMGSLLRSCPILRKPSSIALSCIAGALLLAVHQTMLGLTLLVPAIVIEIGSRSWPLVKDAGRFGDISYGIYIYAWPVQQLYVQWLGANSSYSTLLIPSLATTFALAFASWHLIEKPSLRLKPGRSRESAWRPAALTEACRTRMR